MRESVLSSQELLIKKIARDTAEITAPMINMSQGVPCREIFQESRFEMDKLLDTALLPYSDVIGSEATRQSAASFVNSFYFKGDSLFGVDQVIICAGAIQAVYNCLALSIESRDDIVVTTLPAYGLYQHQTEILGGTFKTISPANSPQSSVPTLSDLRVAFGPERTTKVVSLVLCFPNNPTGESLTTNSAAQLADDLDALIDFYDSSFSIILDEVYFGTHRPASNYASVIQYASKRLLPRILLILSCSKGLGAMPGARAAWITTQNTIVVTELMKVQLAGTGNPSTISQAAMRGALNHLVEHPAIVSEISEYYGNRVDRLIQGLRSLECEFRVEGILPMIPTGTFYVWACFRCFGKFSSDIELVVFLRDLHKDSKVQCGLAVVPGSAFMMPGTDMLVRFSCARDDISDIDMAISILRRAFELQLCL